MLGADAAGGLLPVTWSVDREAARLLPVLDALAVGALEKKDARVRWIEASPRYLGRAFAGRRFARMTNSEADRFVAAAREATPGKIPVSMSIGRGGEAIAISH